MKTKEEIEQLAQERYPNQAYYPYLRKGFIESYTQCQEDMADKKYTFNQMVDAIQMAREINGKETYYKYSIEQILESLNKQD